jgi:hypothetical protein
METIPDVDPAALARLSTEPARPVTDADVEAYERDGAVCLRGVLDAEWCRMLHDAAMQAMTSGRGRVREPKVDQGRFYSSVYQSDFDPRIARLRDRSPAPVVAATLMRCDRVRFFYDQLFIKLPGTQAPTPWHNDLPFWPFRGEHLVSLWIALTPVTTATSGVRYVAGSHRWNKWFRAVTPDYDPRFVDESLETCPDYGAGEGGPGVRLLAWDMQPGDVLCHHPLTVHGAGANTSTTQPRIGLSIRYAGRDVRWDPRPQAMKLRRDPGVAPGEYPDDDVALPPVWEHGRGFLTPA